MAGQLTVRSLSESLVIGPDGKSQVVMQAVFMVGELGPFTHSVPKEQYNAQLFRAELESKARDVDYVAGL